MPKTLTDADMADIIHKAVHDPAVIDCSDAYVHFVEDLADLIEDHFGGEAGSVEYDDTAQEWSVKFYLNDSVPSDGGIFKDYDTKVSWRDGEEIE